MTSRGSDCVRRGVVDQGSATVAVGLGDGAGDGAGSGDTGRAGLG